MVLGISINEEYAYIKVNGIDNVKEVPLTICRSLNDVSWYIGKEAYRQSLNYKGFIVDKLLYVVEKKCTATINGIKYSAETLISNYFKELLRDYHEIEFVTVAVYKNNPIILKVIEKALKYILIDDDKFHITTFSDAFATYMINNDEKYMKDRVGLIEFSNNSLCYYDLNIVIDEQDNKNNYLIIDKKIHPQIPLNVLSKENGIIVCDRLLTEFAKSVTLDNLYSCIIISGSGFKNQNEYKDFINFLCGIGCSVIQEEYIFAIGAMFISLHLLNKRDFTNGFIFISDARVSTNVDTKLYVDYKEVSIQLAKIGEEWFYEKNDFQIIVDDVSDNMVFNLSYYDKKISDIKKFSFKDFFNIRKNKTTMINVLTEFPEKNLFHISFIDRGFGEFFESSVNTGYIDLEL